MASRHCVSKGKAAGDGVGSGFENTTVELEYTLACNCPSTGPGVTESEDNSKSTQQPRAESILEEFGFYFEAR